MRTRYDFGDPARIDGLALAAEGWRRPPQSRLGQLPEIVAQTHHLGALPNFEFERRPRGSQAPAEPHARLESGLSALAPLCGLHRFDA